jgi:hypothetical protein
MHFPTLMAQCDPPGDMAALVAELTALKARTRELGSGPLPSPIAAFIEQEYATAEAELADVSGTPDAEAVARADEFLLRVLAR